VSILSITLTLQLLIVSLAVLLVTCVLPLCTDTLADAGCNESDLPLAKLLRKRGAAWPDQLGHSTLDRCWCAAAVAWARAEGCAAPALAVDADDGADDGDY
jgi:hypothetical protein